jgi:L-asparaginase
MSNINRVVLLAGLAWLATAPTTSVLAQVSAPAAAPPAATQPQRPVVALIATGGTIAMKIDPVRNAPVPAISGEDLLATVPDISKHAQIEVNNLSNVPSDYMDPPRWVALTRAVQDTLARPEVAGVVVSHGTDTLEETAWWLDLTVASDKPVVLIGAQRNASESDFDGPRNLLNAVRIATDPASAGKGAVLAMNNQINAARQVTKTHTTNVETFQSGQWGLLGAVDPDRVVWSRAPLRRQHVPIRSDAMPPVEIVAMYGGADGQLVRAAIDQGARGVVVQALGMGNMNRPMFAAIKDAIGRGVPVVVASRVPEGRVLPSYGFEGGGKTLADAGAVMADDLSPQKARILLMLLLQGGTRDRGEIQAAFSR